MTCPRPHCGGLLVEDDGEWVCKSCSRRWTDETLAIERSRLRAPAPAKAPSAIEDSVLDRKLKDLLLDEESEQPDNQPPEEAPGMGSTWTPERRAKFAATMAKRHGGTPKPEARSPKSEVRSPKRRGRPPRPTPAGGFDQAAADHGHSNGHLLTARWMDRKTRMLAELEEAETNLAAELEKVREAKKVVGAL